MNDDRQKNYDEAMGTLKKCGITHQKADAFLQECMADQGADEDPREHAALVSKMPEGSRADFVASVTTGKGQAQEDNDAAKDRASILSKVLPDGHDREAFLTQERRRRG